MNITLATKILGPLFYPRDLLSRCVFDVSDVQVSWPCR